MLDALLEWLGEGGHPVAPSLAERRGRICAGCPLNVEPNWLEKFSKEPMMEAIKKTLEIKHDMKIGVESEKNLHICRACGCCLRLKIHEPMVHILHHTPMQEMQKYDDRCWIKHADQI